MIDLPWSKRSQDNMDILRAEKILNEDHYGLEKVKERILEYLAVCNLTNQVKGPVICFVGPPGWARLPWPVPWPAPGPQNLCACL
jgi:ATP-dependent Lon protease